MVTKNYGPGGEEIRRGRLVDSCFCLTLNEVLFLSNGQNGE